MAIKTPAFLLDQLIIQFKQKQTDLVEVVYSENLDYESAVVEYRASTEQSGESQTVSIDNSVLPLLVYNRTRLEYSEKWQNRGLEVIGTVDQNALKPVRPIYKAAFALFTVNFMYLSKDIESGEHFEVNYFAESQSLSALKKAKIIWPEVGEMNYWLKWLPLEEKTFQNETNYYTGLQGSVQIEGFYFLMDRDGKPIKIIKPIIESVATISEKSATI